MVLKEGTAFEQVLTLYRFDKKLCILLFKISSFMDDNRSVVFWKLELYLFKLSSNQLIKRIAGYFGLKPQVFTSWLTVLANLRNMCCHHARVWNRDFMLNPAEPQKTPNTWIDISKVDKKRIYYRLCIIWYLNYYLLFCTR